ncbi:hypothetical protein PybrP1_003038, partial [[Pythium] brassicae (nom. inval.)]
MGISTSPAVVGPVPLVSFRVLVLAIHVCLAGSVSERRLHFDVQLVFVTYARASSVKGAASLVGTVEVFGATAALVDSVSVASKRAMAGAKLAVEVATYVESGRDVLHIAPRNGSAISNSGNTTVLINLAPNVTVANLPTSPSASDTSVRIWSDLNKPFPSDAVTLFVNGTSDLFVLANKSAVYVADFTVRVAGSSRSQ